MGCMDARVGRMDARVGRMDAMVGRMDARVGRMDAMVCVSLRFQAPPNDFLVPEFFRSTKNESEM
jgi:hypothetical protein